MNQLDLATALNAEGRFADALSALVDANPGSISSSATLLLKAELSERVGRFGQSLAYLEQLRGAKHMTPQQHSSCEFIVGKIELEEGKTESAVTHLQRAVALAMQAGDLVRKCWPQMWLLASISDRSGPDAVATLLAELRSDAVKLGDPQVLAGIHLFVGQMEAKRGLLKSARSHVRLGQQVLSGAPNLWIEAMLEITNANIAVMRSDYESALRSGRRAIELARSSGGAASQRTCLANLGFVAYSTGEFEKAVTYFERAIAVLPSPGESHSGMLESLARIRLTQGRTKEAEALLDQLEDSIAGPRDRVLYTYRHALLTRAQLHAKEGRVQDAFEQVDRAMALASEAGDQWLWNGAS